MGVRATSIYLLSTTSLTGPIRVSSTRLAVSHRSVGPVRFTAIPTLVTHAGGNLIRVTDQDLAVTGAQGATTRVTGHYLMVAMSVPNAFWPNLLDEPDTFYEHEFAIDYLAGLIPEHNPYRPNIPEEALQLGDPFYDYLRENQEILREQHNLIQAGDTTFPFQLLYDTQPKPLYRLGAISRFYSDNYGITLARYVQFVHMTDTPFAGAPVGFIKADEKLTWRVTNRFELSDPHLVMGFIGALETPKEDYYGWVIMEGTSFQQIENESESAEFGETFVWSGTGKVKNEGEGIVLARRLDKNENTTILAGMLYIRLESWSVGTIRAQIDDITAQIENAILLLQSDVQDIQSLLGIGLGTTLIAQLLKKISDEALSRKRGDDLLSARIDALGGGGLSAELNALKNRVDLLEAALDARITLAQDTANEALIKANQALGINIAELQDAIASILQRLANERTRPKGRFPVVDGSIPPNLVYTDDGSLVYTETF